MTNQTNKSTINHLDDMSFSSVQVIAWSCALATEAVVIVVGNLLTIVLFALNKKLRSKKILAKSIYYLVLNMAFADLFLGGISLPHMFTPWVLVRLNLMNKLQRFLQLFSSFSLRRHSLPLL
ncbi:unnamed protein product [Porites lobata]|uniref:G-protein coupled receptors family 1 profile domain-containing protein n=1 Tax=Porites lobata TaxID=104759 RepID=A0ABN8Q3I4_9CNID|nr:unnamed protein product [Porites lobata]